MGNEGFSQGEGIPGAGSAETRPFTERPQTVENNQFVEQKATEVPAIQEVRNGQGAGDGNGPIIQFNVPNTTVTSPPAQTQSVSLDDVPVVAADEDLIEKGWVDSVKRIIKDTRSDPYSQGEAISRLQADYLQKRYGKTVGEGNQ